MESYTRLRRSVAWIGFARSCLSRIGKCDLYRARCQKGTLLISLADDPTAAAGLPLREGLAKTVTEGGVARSPGLEATLPTSLDGGDVSEQRSTIGRYELRKKLGEGGMGVVYLAHDPDLDRSVAVKLMHGDSAAHVKRLRKEARSLAKLRHPNVVVVYEVGSHSGEVFIAMEYVEGTSLAEWIKGDHDYRERLDVLRQAAAGLAAAHDAGLVHRDFKPDNVVVGKRGRVQVLDFGLARLADEEHPGDQEPSIQGSLTGLTRTGALVGTPAYMSPEQFLSRPVDARTDQFSFCVTAFETLYGVKPFDGESFSELQDAVVANEVRARPTSFGVPESVHSAIVKGLRPRPGERHLDMDVLLSLLEEPASPRAGRRWGVALGVGAGALAAVAAAAFIWLSADYSDQGLQGAMTAPFAPAPDQEKPWRRGVSEKNQSAALKDFVAANVHLQKQENMEALRLYARAFGQWEHPAISFNMALALYRLGRPVAAYESFKRAAKFPEALSPKVRASMGKHRREILARLTHLTITLSMVDGSVYLDNRQLISGRGMFTGYVRSGARQFSLRQGSKVLRSSEAVLQPGSKFNMHMAKPPAAGTQAAAIEDLKRARTLRIGGTYVAAEKLYRQVLAGLHGKGEAHFGLAWIAATKNQRDAVVRHARMALRDASLPKQDKVGALLFLGHDYHRQKLYTQASKSYREALTLDPENKAAKEALAAVAKARGDNTKSPESAPGARRTLDAKPTGGKPEHTPNAKPKAKPEAK